MGRFELIGGRTLARIMINEADIPSKFNQEKIQPFTDQFEFQVPIALAFRLTVIAFHVESPLKGNSSWTYALPLSNVISLSKLR